MIEILEIGMKRSKMSHMFAVACCIADFMAKFRFNIVFSCIYLWEEALPDKFNHIFVFVIFFGIDHVLQLHMNELILNKMRVMHMQLIQKKLNKNHNTQNVKQNWLQKSILKEKHSFTIKKKK